MAKRKSRKWPEQPPKELLIKIARATLENAHRLNDKPVLKSNIIRTCLRQCGDSFYRHYGKGPENMEKLAEQIRQLSSEDPEFNTIFYDGKKREPRGKLHKLSTKEREIIEDQLLEISQQNSGSLPKGTYTTIQKELEKAGFKLSYSQTHYHSRAIWEGRYTDYIHRTPQRILHKNNSLEQYINTTIKKLEKAEHANPDSALTTLLGNIKERQKRRQKLQEQLPVGHQKLIAHLTARENYEQMLGEGWELVAADLKKENTDEQVYKAAKENLETIVNDPTVEFANDAIRCDLIYRKKGTGGNKNSGIYTTTEVKQRALDRTPPENSEHEKVYIDETGKETRTKIENPEEETPNCEYATHSRQQLAKYCGALLDNIRWKDLQNKDNPGYQAIIDPETGSRVQGVLAAYEIQADIYDYLKNEPDRNALVFSRQTVDKYIEEHIHGKKAEKTAREQTTTLKRVSTPRTNTSTKQALLNRQHNLTTLLNRSKPVPKEKMGPTSQFFYRTLTKAAENQNRNQSPLGTFDPKTNLVALNVYDIRSLTSYERARNDMIGPLYYIDNSNRTLERIQELVAKGVLKEGEINLSPYLQRKTVPTRI